MIENLIKDFKFIFKRLVPIQDESELEFEDKSLYQIVFGNFFDLNLVPPSWAMNHLKDHLSSIMTHRVLEFPKYHEILLNNFLINNR